MNTKSESTLKKMELIMSVRNYSNQSIKTYIGYTKKFLMSFDKDAYHISVIEAKDYLLNYPYTSISQQNQIINAVKLFYKEVIGRTISLDKIKRPKKEKKIDWEYLLTKMPEDQSQIAFGANFYPYLMSGNHNIKVSLYEPEIMSKFLDLSDMSLHCSSFNLNK